MRESAILAKASEFEVLAGFVLSCVYTQMLYIGVFNEKSTSDYNLAKSWEMGLFAFIIEANEQLNFSNLAVSRVREIEAYHEHESRLEESVN